MATAMCFRYILRRSLVKWKKITLPSPPEFWNCKKLMPEYVSKGVISSLSLDLGSEKRKQDGRGGIVVPSVCLGLPGIFYKVVFGTTPAECTGEEENPVINTPSANVEICDSSGRFSSSSKILKTKERKRHATDLLRGIKSAKRKLNYEEKQEEGNEVLEKRTTRSVTDFQNAQRSIPTGTRIVDLEALQEGLKKCSSCMKGAHSSENQA